MTGPSFWHLPRPILGREEGQDTSNQQVIPSAIDKARKESNLRCPNDCPAECYAVYWECGGILDDGTGQARLNASREAALTLLGMTGQTIESIEEGVWNTESGTISYQNSRKPPPYLKPCIEAALSRLRNSNHGQKQHPKEALKYLNPETRAEYLMYTHCRSSSRPRRTLDYFVRCRPLSDTVDKLNQTEAKIVRPKNGDKNNGEIVVTGMPTYSLPPLKLDLVDCSIPSNEGIGYYNPLL